MDFSRALHEIHEHLNAIEAAARKMPNQNFADIAKAASWRLGQLRDHPDVEAAGDHFKAHLEAERVKAEAEKAAASNPFPPVQ